MRNFIRFRHLNVNLKVDDFDKLRNGGDKRNCQSIITFLTGTTLAISESLPFMNNEYNGLIDALIKIQQEFKQYFTKN